MEAAPTKVIHYFNGEKQNLIPLFQRPYSWKPEHWETLWSDILAQYDLDQPGAHFMGAIVSVPARSVPVGVSKFLIIDGQQRLTTVSILLCALRDSLGANDASRVQEVYLVNKYREPADTLKFVPTQQDREAYNEIARGKPTQQRKSAISSAYEFFVARIANGLNLSGEEKVDASKILTIVEQALQVVMINLGETDDPYLIFESLNFKGQPLAQSDLVRNFILMQFQHSPSQGGEQERIFQEYWQPLENLLKADLTEFLRYYAMRDGDVISLGGIYAATKLQFREKSSTEVEVELLKMNRFAAYFAKFVNPNQEVRLGLRLRLSNIRALGVTTSYPLLLRLFDANHLATLSDDDLERCLGLIESFVVRRSVCGVPTNALNKLFLQWAKNFQATDCVEWLHRSLSAGGTNTGRRFPSDVEFSEAFRIQPQYGRGATRFVLIRLEQSFAHKEPIDLNSCTIEHILPQTITPDWEAEIGGVNSELHALLVHTIGNLTLTAHNTELGNVDFQAKKLRLANTHVELNRWIVEQSRWSEAEIQHRANRLLSIANSIWAGPLTE